MIVISCIWEGLQKIVAHLVILFSHAEYCGEYEGAKLYFWRHSGGMSLSTHIFLPFGELTMSDFQRNYIKHEYGHTRQSKYLGPFYLLVIGLPSLLWASCGKEYRQKHNKSYYSFYTERWANKLGGSNLE